MPDFNRSKKQFLVELKKRIYAEMKLKHNILLLLSVLLASCTEDGGFNPDEPASNGITVFFQAGSERMTRSTNLISSDNRQHVKYVRLYVFDTATGICLQSKDVNWNQPVGDMAKQSYKLTGLTNEKEYTLLAVGLDELPSAGTTTYGLPEAILENTTSLAGLKATLHAGKTQADIARSELYSGWKTITAGTTTGVTLSLERRVAGILAYLKNIPPDVATIQLKLYKNQYRDVLLQKADTVNKYDSSDHGSTELADSQVILNISVNDTEKNKTEVDDGHGSILSKQAGTVLQGAYVLPIEAPVTANTYTLRLETFKADGTLLKTYFVKILAQTEQGGTPTEKPLTNYPLYANQFYSLGKKNATTDEPLALGEDTVITVNPMWEGMSDDIPLE